MALTKLLETLDPQADLVHRHLWLIALVDWIRGNNLSVAEAVSRVGFLLDQVEAHPEIATRLHAWWQTLASALDGATLLSHYDMASRNAFVSELVERLHRKCLPASPDTRDASVLFALVFNSPVDALWIAALPRDTLARLARLLTAPALSLDTPKRPLLTLWQEVLLDAITFCTSQVQAAGFSPDLRLRMSHFFRLRQIVMQYATLGCPMMTARKHCAKLCNTFANNWMPADRLPALCIAIWIRTVYQ